MTLGKAKRTIFAVIASALVFGAGPWGQSSALSSEASGVTQPPASVGMSAHGEPLRAPAAYYRPVLVHGNAFPLARSNFLSLIQIFNNWHAPRLRLVNGTWQLVGVHEGIDIAAERGTPILAMAEGVVDAVGWTFYSGTRIGVRGNDGRYYLFAHLSEVAPGIRLGARVSAGDFLGRVGNTGYGPPGHRDVFPPHLHVGILAGARWVDPYGVLASLYGAAVSADREAQARLDALALDGRTAAWHHAVSALLLPLAAPKGE